MVTTERHFGRPDGVKLALEQRSEQPCGAKLALERRFGPPGGIKLALERRKRQKSWVDERRREQNTGHGTFRPPWMQKEPRGPEAPGGNFV